MSAADAIEVGHLRRLLEPDGDVRLGSADAAHQRLHDRRDLLDPAKPGEAAARDARGYPVDVTIPEATKQVSNGAPYGLGANYVEFTPGSASGPLTLTFDGTDGHAWRVSAIVFGNGGPSVVPSLSTMAPPDPW